MPKTLVYGNEPYLIDKFRKKLMEQIETPEMNFMDTEEFTEEEKRFICQYPLFGEKKVLFFYAKTLEECTDLIEFIQKRGKNADVYLFPKKVDKRTKVYRMFASDETQVYNKVAQDVLGKTIMHYIKKTGCEITGHAYQLFLQLINYYSDETNLYDVIHALERICSVKKITKEVVENMVMDREEEDIYSLIELIMRLQYAQMYRQADLILQRQQNNVISILSLLLRSYRLAYKMQICNCSLKDIGVAYRTFVPKLQADSCSQAMSILNEAVVRVKRGFYNPEVALKTTLAKLSLLTLKGE